MNAVEELTPVLGVRGACEAMGTWRGAPARHRAGLHRKNFVGPLAYRHARPRPPLALHAAECALLLSTLNSDRFVDDAPATVFATLLDEGRYLGSIRTMYRLLQNSVGGARDRRDQLIHPAYAKPELLAVKPNEVWSWDITKLKGPRKSPCYHLYVILDIFSRYAVGWMIAAQEQSHLAAQLIEETILRQGIGPGTLTLHADRGASMRSKPVAALLVDLQVIQSHSRPYISDDNPFSEAQFKTMKYRPQFPERFASIEQARAHCREFFDWYNERHRHSGVGYMTPHRMHYGLSGPFHAIRQATLEAAFAAHPIRFTSGHPRAPVLPTAVWINPPQKEPGTDINTINDTVNS